MDPGRVSDEFADTSADVGFFNFQRVRADCHEDQDLARRRLFRVLMTVCTNSSTSTLSRP